MRVVSALCLLAAVLIAAADAGRQQPFPLLFVSKKVARSVAPVGIPTEVTVEVFNSGQSPAFDVKLFDVLSDGEVKRKEVAHLSYGENLTMSYSVVPTELGSYPIGVAEVTYATIPGGDVRFTARSNQVREDEALYRGEEYDDKSFRGVLSVVTKERYNRLNTRYIMESTVYVFLGILPALFPFAMYRMKQNEVDYLLHRSKKK